MIWHKTGPGPRVGNANKYHAKKTVIEVEGKPHVFDSHAEARYYLRLKTLQTVGEITSIELQPKFELQPGYQKCCGKVWTIPVKTCFKCGKKIPKTPAIPYTADFRVTYKDGHVEIIDVKGVETREFIRVKKIFEYRYPELTLKEIGSVV